MTTRLKAFSIFDVKAEAYMPPFFMPTTAMAIRAFGSDVSNGASQFAKHPSDFLLYEVGGFDDSTGRFLVGDPLVISRATDFIQAPV